MCMLFLAHKSTHMYYVHCYVITCASCVAHHLFSMIQWKIPRLPLCRLRKHRGCNQSSGCFSHNPLCLSRHYFPIKGALITGNSAGNMTGRWEVGMEEEEQTSLLKPRTVTSDVWLCNMVTRLWVIQVQHLPFLISLVFFLSPPLLKWDCVILLNSGHFGHKS